MLHQNLNERPCCLWMKSPRSEITGLDGSQHLLQGKIRAPRMAEAEWEGFWSGGLPSPHTLCLFLCSEPSRFPKTPSRKEAGQASEMSTRSTPGQHCPTGTGRKRAPRAIHTMPQGARSPVTPHPLLRLVCKLLPHRLSSNVRELSWERLGGLFKGTPSP